jgi:tetratricopeptide (TPR) repeat protein
MNPDELLSRRDALRMLAALPIEMYGLSAFKPVLKCPPEEILVQCAAGITACWQLRRGKELTFAASVVSQYLPTLQEIARSARNVQRIGAADLLSQCYLLKSLLAVHLGESTAASLHYATLAEQYGERAGSIVLQIVALRAQANAHDYADHWEQASQAAQKAQYLLEINKEAPVPPLIVSYVYSGLANYQGHMGKTQDALRTLGRAHAAFFAQPGNSAPPIWIDHDQGNLLLHDGLAHYYLGLQKQAIDSFAQISALPRTARKETTHGEALIDQVLAEIQREDQPRDRNFCITLWTQGMQQAAQMRSEERYNEALAAYTAMRAAWPGESRIKELRDLAVHW